MPGLGTKVCQILEFVKVQKIVQKKGKKRGNKQIAIISPKELVGKNSLYSGRGLRQRHSTGGDYGSRTGRYSNLRQGRSCKNRTL